MLAVNSLHKSGTFAIIFSETPHCPKYMRYVLRYIFTCAQIRAQQTDYGDL